MYAGFVHPSTVVSIKRPSSTNSARVDAAMSRLLAVVVGQVADGADAVMARREFEHVLARVVLRGSRQFEDSSRDHPFGEVVDTGEVGGATHGGQRAGVEQVLERDLAVVPVPPRTLRADAQLEVTGDDRPLVAHPGQDVVDELRVVAANARHGPPAVVLRHVPPQVRVQFDGHVTRLVDVELEQLVRGRGVGDQRSRMRSEPGEQRQLLAAHEHVDRVDLDEPHPVDHPTEMTTVDAALRPRVVEALGRERDTSSLRPRDDGCSRHRGAADVSRRRR